ncbi:hypothetical protein Tharo_0945 [Thauera aromatica K172]|uniref:Uncharacterized protein n=1 Tax=Thauera aromatica K172 TaxID=44139 RepID=A0A2R4BKM6_THAAR|nr:hypothetical protein Tharo_0945 [Thauera aromatica K172]
MRPAARSPPAGCAGAPEVRACPAVAATPAPPPPSARHSRHAGFARETSGVCQIRVGRAARERRKGASVLSSPPSVKRLPAGACYGGGGGGGRHCVMRKVWLFCERNGIKPVVWLLQNRGIVYDPARVCRLTRGRNSNKPITGGHAPMGGWQQTAEPTGSFFLWYGLTVDSTFTGELLNGNRF